MKNTLATRILFAENVFASTSKQARVIATNVMSGILIVLGVLVVMSSSAMADQTTMSIAIEQNPMSFPCGSVTIPVAAATNCATAKTAAWNVLTAQFQNNCVPGIPVGSTFCQQVPSLTTCTQVPYTRPNGDPALKWMVTLAYKYIPPPLHHIGEIIHQGTPREGIIYWMETPSDPCTPCGADGTHYWAINNADLPCSPCTWTNASLAVTNYNPGYGWEMGKIATGQSFFFLAHALNGTSQLRCLVNQSLPPNLLTSGTNTLYLGRQNIPGVAEFLIHNNSGWGGGTMSFAQLNINNSRVRAVRYGTFPND